jgi:hypothetical protein
MSILQNIGYRLVPLWCEEIISGALTDMKRAGQQYEPEIYDEDNEIMQEKESLVTFEEGKPMSSGKAVMGPEEQMTPAETPMVGDFDGTRNLSLEARKAFSGSSGKEPFPVYIDPGIE